MPQIIRYDGLLKLFVNLFRKLYPLIIPQIPLYLWGRLSHILVISNIIIP